MGKKKKKVTDAVPALKERNFVAKNDFNVGGAHKSKKDYKRRDKHRAGKSDLGREV